VSDPQEDALASKKETTSIEFKERFDPTSAQDWCEIVKDIVAIANTGGGVIIFGVADSGDHTGEDLGPLLKLDVADIADKVYKYTGSQFGAFALEPLERSGSQLVALTIGGAAVPLVFCRPGTYSVGDGKQKTAFGVGTIYFRHGPKSEPGSTEDLRASFERQLASVREAWLGNIRHVMEAPPGSRIVAIAPEADLSEIPFRLSDDPNAPVLGRGPNRDDTHPYRMTELIAFVNERLPEGIKINQHDILCITRVFSIATQPRFHHQPRYGSPQYSEKFARWIVERYMEDETFFETTRHAFKQRRNQ
jgi:hypothetical protein